MTHVNDPWHGQGAPADVLHAAEQQWAKAQEHLDIIMDRLRDGMLGVTVIADTDDLSVKFTALLGFIRRSNGGHPTYNPNAVTFTEVLAAAAITRLMAQPTSEDPLTQLEKEMNIDDH